MRKLVAIYILEHEPSKEEVLAISEIVRLTFNELGYYEAGILYPCAYGNSICFFIQLPLEELEKAYLPHKH